MGLLYLIFAIFSERKSFWRNCIVLAIISGLITVGWDVYMHACMCCVTQDRPCELVRCLQPTLLNQPILFEVV